MSELKNPRTWERFLWPIGAAAMLLCFWHFAVVWTGTKVFPSPLNVEKGIAEAMSSGGVFGYPVVDVEVACYDGKFHSVDSSEMSFKMAGSLAFREAMAKAQPVLLEPISRIEITVPPSMQGDVLGDLNSRRGRVQGTDTLTSGDQCITALVPTAEIQRYAIDLRSLTAGRGNFHAEHDHYDTVPANLVDKLVKTKGD